MIAACFLSAWLYLMMPTPYGIWSVISLPCPGVSPYAECKR